MNHRMAGVEKDHNDNLISTPCYVQGGQPPDQAAKSHIQPGDILESILKHFFQECVALALQGAQHITVFLPSHTVTHRSQLKAKAGGLTNTTVFTCQFYVYRSVGFGQ